MVPNLDLIVLAFLHGTFIAGTLLVVILAIVLSLFLGALVSLLALAVVDIYDSLLILAPYLEIARANLMLGGVLVLCKGLHCVVFVALAFKPWVRHWFLQLKARKPRLPLSTLL